MPLEITVKRKQQQPEDMGSFNDLEDALTEFNALMNRRNMAQGRDRHCINGYRQKQMPCAVRNARFQPFRNLAAPQFQEPLQSGQTLKTLNDNFNRLSMWIQSDGSDTLANTLNV